MTDERELTERQKQILQVIRASVAERGYPPSVREIGQATGLRSPSSVHSQLASLERAGKIRRDPTKPRTVVLLENRADRRAGLASEPSAPPAREDVAEVPLLGQIAAGAPIVADEHVEDVVALPESLVGQGRLFMLRVRGDSMIEAGVFDGDLVVVRQQPTVEQGEMCAALVDGEATVKFFRRTPSGEVFLDPANPGYQPIPVTPDAQASVLGRVVTVLRRV